MSTLANAQPWVSNGLHGHRSARSTSSYQCGVGLSTIRYLARRGLRARPGGWLLVGLLTALTVTVSGGALTVARHTLEAHPRLLDSINAPDVSLGIGIPGAPGPPEPVAPSDLAAMEGVDHLTVVRNTLGTEVDAEGRFVPDGTTGLVVAVDGDPAVPLLRGRLPAPDATDEVAISVGAADRLAADLGDRIRYAVVTWSEYEEIVASGADHGGSIVTPEIVGVYGSTTLDGPADAPTQSSTILASRAFLDAHPDIGTYQVASVWLRDGTATDAFVRRLEDEIGADRLDIQPRPRNEAAVRRSVQPEAYAVAGIALAVGLAGLIVTAQAIGRQLAGGHDELSLLAMGMTRRQRAGARWVEASTAIAVGVVLGAAGGTLTGRRWGAIGVARAFDVAGGPPPAFTPVVIVVGALTVALLVAAAVSAWRAARLERHRRASATWHASLRAAAPLWVRTGTALSARGTGAALAARGAIAGTATSVVIIVSVITFGSSLDALVATPALYGHDYDIAAWDGYGMIDDDVITDALTSDADVVGIARVAGSTGTVDGRDAGLSGYDDLSVGLRLTGGELPRDAGQVLLGRRLAHRLDAGPGDVVVVRVGTAEERFEVVGTGVLPGDLGDGAAFTLEGLHRVTPTAEIGSQYVRLAPGADPQAAIARFRSALGCNDDCDVTAPEPPADLTYLDRVGDLPRLSAGVMLAVGIAMTIHALAVVGRRSRRSLAVLRAMGATRRQVMGFLLGQAAYIVVAASVLGVGLGVLAGRALWRIVADALGVVPEAHTSGISAAAAVAALATIAIAVAAVPSWRAARRPAAAALRAD